MGKTYIFFEPKNENFFEGIANIYCELIRNYYRDAEKAYSEGDSHNFYQNYVCDLLFPACDYNGALRCPHTICGSDKCPVLTEDQKERISISLKDVIYKLRAVHNINNLIVDRIYQNCFFLLCTKTRILPYRYINILALYLQLMREVSGEIDVEKLVYVSSENSDYNYFRDEMLKSYPNALEECTCYQ
jgi:hypothetical protein